MSSMLPCQSQEFLTLKRDWKPRDYLISSLPSSCFLCPELCPSFIVYLFYEHIHALALVCMHVCACMCKHTHTHVHLLSAFTFSFFSLWFSHFHIEFCVADTLTPFAHKTWRVFQKAQAPKSSELLSLGQRGQPSLCFNSHFLKTLTAKGQQMGLMSRGCSVKSAGSWEGELASLLGTSPCLL